MRRVRVVIDAVGGRQAAARDRVAAREERRRVAHRVDALKIVEARRDDAAAALDRRDHRLARALNLDVNARRELVDTLKHPPATYVYSAATYITHRPPATPKVRYRTPLRLGSSMLFRDFSQTNSRVFLLVITACSPSGLRKSSHDHDRMMRY